MYDYAKSFSRKKKEGKEVMKFHKYEAKNLTEAVSKAILDLSVPEEDLIINIIEEKSGLFKKCIIEVTTINEVIHFIKENITEITKLMNIEVNQEVRRRENVINITLFSSNNSILIGKNGKTITALQTIIKQILYTQIKDNVKIVLDVENYKEKRMKNISFLAQKIAREVAETKVEVQLERMNSYERRLVHEALAENKYVYTESIGEEPNRCVVIKPRED